MELFVMNAFENVNVEELKTNDMNRIEIWEDGDLDGPALAIYTPEGSISLDHHATIQLFSLLKSHEKRLSKKVIVVK